MRYGVTVKVAFLVPLYFAVILGVRVVVTDGVLIVNVAVVPPPGIVTEAGTVA